MVALENGVYQSYVILNSNTPSAVCERRNYFPFSASNLRLLPLPSGYNLLADSNPKFADFNFDGLPDIIAIFSVKKFKKTTILINYGSLNFDVFNIINIE